MGITPKSEIDLIGAVWRMRPDTIVLSQSSRLTTAARLLHQFSDSPNLQIIAVNPHENSVEVYGRKRMPVTPANNLTAMIQSCCYSNCGFPTAIMRALDRNLQKPANTIELS
ncbi:MAG TPA: hypothetical protein ENK32_10470 [Anaerolineae bacterium]|nr:hypothetical protein [Anaerolineae bacterium]